MSEKIATLEEVLIGGNLKALKPEERVTYYNRVCASLSLNPLTKPFEYLELNGKLILYARRDCAEQLRKRDKVSTKIVDAKVVDGCYVVTVEASTPDGRVDSSVGAVWIENLAGEPRANAYMKAETKAKRRVTLSICGLGMLDETEVESFAPVQQHTKRLAEPKFIPSEDKPLIQDIIASLGECKNKLEAADLGERVKADTRLTEGDRVYLRPPFAKALKSLPAAVAVNEDADEVPA